MYITTRTNDQHGGAFDFCKHAQIEHVKSVFGDSSSKFP